MFPGRPNLLYLQINKDFSLHKITLYKSIHFALRVLSLPISAQIKKKKENVFYIFLSH